MSYVCSSMWRDTQTNLQNNIRAKTQILASNENAHGEVQTCQNLHFHECIYSIGLKINRVLYSPKIHLYVNVGENMSKHS